LKRGYYNKPEAKASKKLNIRSRVMKKITKNEIKNILGSGATSKQVDIVFTLIDFQSETLKEKISKEVQKLEEKKIEALKKIETDFEKKSEEVFDRTLTKTVQDILKKNRIKISQVVKEKVEESETEAVGETEEKSETNFSQGFYNRY